MAKKNERETAIKQGLRNLREADVDTEKIDAASLDSLTGRLGKDHDTDVAIAFLLGSAAAPAAVDALVRLERRAEVKDLKREIRRSLFRLGQKGLSVPGSGAAAAPARPALRLGPEIEGYFCLIDGAGDRLVWLARPQPGAGMLLLQGMVSDRRGLLRAGGAQLSRKHLRARMREIRESGGVALAPVAWEYADRMLYEAHEKAKSLGQGAGEFPSMRAAFNQTKPRELPHPIYARLSPEEALAGDWRARSRRLLDEPEFRFWILDRDWLAPYLERVEEAETSRLVLNEAQKEERFTAIVRDAAREIFAGESGAIFRRRMEDAALCLLEGGRREPALPALAVALQLAEGAPGILDISFLTGLAQKSLAFYLAQAKEKAKEEPSLIVKP